jgi:biotin transport system substrate-specific component
MNNDSSSSNTPPEPSIALGEQGTIVSFLFQAALGAAFLAFFTLWEIPIQPVPITLHTLGIFLLSFVLGGEKAFAAIVLYLLMATVGMPLLSGGTANPLWLLSPTGGFLLSFPIASLWLGKRLEKKISLLQILNALCLCQLLIWLLGAFWLTFFIGPANALLYGIVLFIPGSMIKIAFAWLFIALCRRFFPQFFGAR